MKTAEEIPSEIVTKMQKEFQPELDTSFQQGMYSGYAFGLQDGYKYASQKHKVGYPTEFIRWIAVMTNNQEMLCVLKGKYFFMMRRWSLPELFEHWQETINL